MNRQILLTAIIGLLFPFAMRSQLSGVYAVPGTYTSIGAAINALNTQGVNGAVTVNVAAGHIETVPTASGYTLFTVAGASAVNNITFRKNGFGANPLLVGGTGTATPSSATQDGVWLFVGADYITVDGIDILDPNVSNPATMEFGYGFFKMSSSNGCQFNTIRNCVVTMNAINNALGSGPSMEGSKGIYFSGTTTGQMTAFLSSSTISGNNSGNTVSSNFIQNCNFGIAFSGSGSASPFTLSDANNTIGGLSPAEGNTIVNFGGGGSSANAAGIRTTGQYNLTVSHNVLNSNDGSGNNHPQSLRGIYLQAATGANVSVTHNTITIKGAPGGSQNYAIENSAGTGNTGNQVEITNNLVTGCGISASANIQFLGIFNSAAPSTLNISQNAITNNSTSATSSTHYFILNTGAVASRINISQNDVNGFSFTNPGTAGLGGIANQSGVSTCSLTIADNTISAINASGNTGTFNFILNSASLIQQRITGNRFVNISLFHSGNLNFISNGATIPANGLQDISDNAIVGSFSKTAGGFVSLYAGTGAINSGAQLVATGNDFSNIQLASSTMNGWQCTGNGFGTKSITANRFQNWTNNGVNFSNTVLNAELGGNNSVITSNTITGINVAGAVCGIQYSAINSIAQVAITNNFIQGIASTGSTQPVSGIQVFSSNASLQTIGGNTISTLSSTGQGTISGIYFNGSQNADISSNRIFGLQGSVSQPSVVGIHLGNGSTLVYNNLVGDLLLPNASGPAALIGINIISGSHRLFHNTIHLDATSSAPDFGSSGIYMAAAPMVYLRNNIIINKSTQNGLGLTVALRRATTSLLTYSTTSNNNLFYAGTPSPSHVLYYDGTSAVPSLTTMTTLLSPREAVSVTENTTFQSLSGANPLFLHPNTSFYTLTESGGANVGVTSDIDNEIRHGNIGYTGFGTAPDIGADEFDGSAQPCTTVSAGSVTSNSTLNCIGQSVQLVRSGGSGGPDFSYQWKISPTAGGTYTNVSGGSGATSTSYSTAPLNSGMHYFILVTTCSASAISASTSPILITTNAHPTISVPGGTMCLGNSFTLNPSGATSYSVPGGSSLVVSPTVTRNYTVTGFNGPCISVNNAVATITVIPLPVISLASTTICPGTNHTFTPSGASTYTYHNGGPVVSPSVVTSYSVSGSNTAGCVSSSPAVATVSIQGTFAISAPNGTICPGGIFTITPSGAATYTYSSGSTTVNPVATTNYSVRGTSAAGCPAANTVVVNVAVAPKPTVSVQGGTVCSGNNFTIQPSGAANYSFSSGASVVTPTSNTSYTVSGTSAQGCASANTVVITVTAVALPTISISNGTLCTGMSYTLNPSGALTYTFSGGSAVVSPTNITSYSVTGTAANGCVSKNPAVATLTAYVSPTISIAGPFFACSGVPVTFTATGANTYSWSNGSIGYGVLTPSANTVYSVTGEDVVGCRATASRTLNVSPTPTLTISRDTTICKGQALNIAVSGASTYTWNTSHNTHSIHIVPSVTQQFKVTGATLGCTASAVTSVTVLAIPQITIVSSKQTICADENITVNASGAQNYTWQGAPGAQTPFTPTVTTFTVIGEAANGCTATAKASITVHPLPSLVVTAEKNPLCIGDKTKLYSSSTGSVTWSSGQTTKNITVSPATFTVYTVTAKSKAGCLNSASYTLEVSGCTQMAESSGVAWKVFPNPASDKINIVVKDQGAELKMLASDGRLVLFRQIQQTSEVIDIGELAPGCYHLMISKDGRIVHREKLIRE